LWSECCVGRWTLHSTASCQSPAWRLIMISAMELSLYTYVDIQIGMAIFIYIWCSMSLEAIDPAVPNAVTELLLLSV
jgi:hypothetical protein